MRRLIKKTMKSIPVLVAIIALITVSITSNIEAHAEDPTSSEIQETSPMMPPPVMQPEQMKLYGVEQVYHTTKLKVTWRLEGNIKGYELYRKVGKGDWKKVTTTTATNYTDKSTKKGKTYAYKIRAYKTDGSLKVYGDYSPIIKITVVAKSNTVAKQRSAALNSQALKSG